MTEEPQGEYDMKITIKPDQIKSGEHLMFVGKKRQADIENRVNRHEPILLSSPVHSEGKTYGIIVPLSLTPTDTSKWRLRFRPVAVNVFAPATFDQPKFRRLFVISMASKSCSTRTAQGHRRLR